MKDMEDMGEGKEEQHQGADDTLSVASTSEPTHEMTQSGATPTTNRPNLPRSVSFACDHAHTASTTDDNNHRGGQGYEEFLALLASPSNEDTSSVTPSPSSSSPSMDTLSIAEAQEPRTVPFTSENTHADGEHDSALAADGSLGKSFLAETSLYCMTLVCANPATAYCL